MKYLTENPEESAGVAEKLAQKYRGGAVLGLTGPLGAGKTIFAQGFARGLGIKEQLVSPTFILMRQYIIPGNSEGKLFHIDLYRLEGAGQAEALGLDEIFTNPHNIILIEWAEKLRPLLPKNHITIQIEILSGQKRQIIING